MKVTPLPIISVDGKLFEHACEDCDNPARVKYEIGNLCFNLCVVCILSLERRVSGVLKKLLNEREH